MTPGRRALPAPLRRLAAHPLAVDALLAVGLWLILCLPFAFELSGGLAGGRGGARFLAYSALMIPVVWRRTNPVASGGVLVLMHLAQLFAGLPVLPPNLVVLVSLYSLAAYAPSWAGRAGLLIAVLGGAAIPVRDIVLSGHPENHFAPVVLAAGGGAFATASWLLGKVVRSRRELWIELTDRAARLEYEQEQERRLSAADERARISREMHDIVAHSLSVIVTQADGGSYIAATQPERARETLATIGGTARESLAEMRRLLGVMRRDDVAETAPPPALASIDALIADVRRAGIDVELKITGTPRPSGLAQGAELAAYRVVQESLTNVMKHAGPGVRVRVRLSWDEHGLLIVVLDDGRGLAADRAPRGSGQGIQGMRERVGLYDGTLEAQPRLGGGFGVHAHIPYSSGEHIAGKEIGAGER